MTRKTLAGAAGVAVLGGGSILLLANGWMGTGTLVAALVLTGVVYTLLVEWLL